MQRRIGGYGRLVVLLIGAIFALSACAAQAAVPAPVPSGSSEPACAVGDQLSSKGLLDQAEQQYVSALPSPTASASSKGPVSGSPGQSTVNCAVTGLFHVALKRQRSAVLAAQGDAVRASNPARAHDLYNEALKDDRSNEVAAKGLQTLDAQSATPVKDAANWWADFLTNTAAPLGQLLLWFLSALVALYLLVLLTRLAAGLHLPSSGDADPAKVPQDLREFMRGLAVAVPAVLLAATGVFAAFADWPIAVGSGVLALLTGILFSALYLRMRIRLQLDVRDSEGNADGAAADYLAWRLNELGTEPPRGIHLPRQADVTELPEAALSFLPGGGVLAGLFSLLNTRKPVSPWHVAVTLIEVDRISVTIERCGRTVKQAVADLGTTLIADIKSADSGQLGKPALLTIAAAIILRTLADTHPELEQGLTGAKDAGSIAAQVIGCELSSIAYGELRKSLLARAVALDPENMAARVAYLRVTDGDTSDATGQRTCAEKLQAVYDQHIAGGEDGWRALQWRVLYNLAAARYNAFLFERAYGDPEGNECMWNTAYAAARQLAQGLPANPKDRTLSNLCNEMKGRTKLLWDGLIGTKPTQVQCPEDLSMLTELINKWGNDDATKVEKTARAYYDTACCYAELRDYNKALEDLTCAILDPECKVWARTDASFAELRNPYDLMESRTNFPTESLIATFYAKVGEACPARFTTLAPFAKYEETLQEIGVRSPKDLAHMTETQHQVAQLAKDFALPELEICRWRDIATLGSVVCAGTRPTDEHYQDLLALLALLLAADIESLKALRQQTANFPILAKILRREAIKSSVPPPSKVTLLKWANASPHHIKRPR